MPPRKQSAPARIQEAVIEEPEAPDDAVTEEDFEPEE
jgi:hypothetical protein